MPTNDSEHTLVRKRAVAEPAPELPQGSEIDRYVVLEVLGQGGMGVVYKAYDPQLNRGVALKLIRARQQDSEGETSIGSVRLLREAQALAKLNHPNVVSVHAVGTFEGQVFVAMELVGGRTLNAWYKETKPSTAEVLEVMMTAGRGLDAAHKAGLIHRDFKPSNVIVGEDGRVRVIDFGLACAGTKEPSAPVAEERDLEEIESAETRVRDTHVPRVYDSSDSSQTALSSLSKDFLSTPLTHVGSIVGTPLYMAPEQHLGAGVDARADQFSFCAVLYEFLYGRRPFSGKSRKELIQEIFNGRVRPRPTLTDVPKWLHGIVVRGLSRTPDERYTSMEQLLELLRRDPQEEGRRQRAARKRKLFVMVSVVLAVVLPLGVWYGLRVRTARLCQATQGELGGVWDSASKDAIRTAFLDIKKSYAADTWQRVGRAFDNYTAEWTEMRADVCEARWLSGTQSEEVFDLRMSCLRKRIGELGALVRVFARADAGVVQKAVQASSSLTGIATCADEEALRAPYPPPKTAEARAKVAAIREKLAEVAAFKNTGKYQEGLELVRKLEEKAKTVDYQPVQAEVLFRLGQLQYRTGEYKTAEMTLHEAARAAGKSKDHRLAAEAMTNLLVVVSYAQGRPEDGLLIGRDAEAVVELGGGDAALRSQLLNDMGIALESKGRSALALEYHRKALAIRQKVLGPDHPHVALSLNNLGVVFWRQGEYDRALEYYRDALAIRRKVLGPEHPSLGYTLNNMGLVYWKNGKYDQAHESLRKALVIWETALGPEHPLLVWPLSGIGNLFVDQERPQQAIGPLERALGVCKTKTCQQEPHSRALFSLARALGAKNGDGERAVRLARQARELLGETPYLQKELEKVNAWLKERGAEQGPM